MAKNAYLARLQEQKQREMAYTRLFTIQWCADAAILAAHEVFHRRGDKIDEFYRAFRKWSTQIAQTTLDDAKDDRHIDYTKGKVDKMLFDILGEEHFKPWEERYDIR